MSGAASNPVSPSRWPLGSRLPFPSRPTLSHTKLCSDPLRAVPASRQDHLLIQLESCLPTATREELLQRGFERVKIQTVKSCHRDGKVLRGDENWYCEGNCVRVCFTSVILQPRGLYERPVEERKSPMAIPVKECKRPTVTFPLKVSRVNLSLIVWW